MANRLRCFVIGDTLPINIVATLNGQPVSLANATLWCTAKINLTDPDSEAVFQVSEEVPDNPETQAGKATITVPSTSTKLAEPGTLWMDVQRVFNSVDPPDVWTLFREQVKAVLGVTDADGSSP